MKVKAIIKFKGSYRECTIGRIGRKGIFKFRSNQIRKACFNSLKETFSHDCPGGTLTIRYIISKDTIDPIQNNIAKRNAQMAKNDGFIMCYQSVVPEKQDSKRFILTYKK